MSERYDEGVRLAEDVHRLLRSRSATVAVAESLTGGLVAATLTSVAGASVTFRGGVTAYATDLKGSLLAVDAALLAAQGAVHPDVARQMAAGVRRLLGASYGLATTGVAGPEPQDSRPVGTVHVAIVGDDVDDVWSLRLSGDRRRIRQGSVATVLELLRRALEERS